MYLYVFDFWGVVILAFAAGLLSVGIRLVWFLAHVSENTIIMLARMGAHRFAKSLLSVLINYDQNTYRQSRYIVWNQIATRFAILWGVILIIISSALLFQSWYLAAVLIGVATVSILLIRQWRRANTLPIAYNDQALSSLMQDVNERIKPAKRYVGPAIRPWDYLDELFAQPAY